VRDAGGVRDELAADEAMLLVQSGIAHGGMGVKLSAAVKALDSGVSAVRIGDAKVLTENNAGTVLRAVSQGAA
jgi:acetylglutamate kinase